MVDGLASRRVTCSSQNDRDASYGLIPEQGTALKSAEYLPFMLTDRADCSILHCIRSLKKTAWVYLTYASGDENVNRTTVGRGRLLDNTLTDFEEIFRVSAR
jgi:hypothetical protein